MDKELNYLIYHTPEEDVSINAVVKDDTIWLTQKTMAELFECSSDNISLHLKNIFSDGELDKNSVTEKISATAADGRILKSDVTVAKNYLEEKQIRQLERTVTSYFDYIEDLIERENAFTMKEFSTSINEFLAFRKYNISEGKGSVSKNQADSKAKEEYDAFNKTQKMISDFEKEITTLSKGGCSNA